jgi:hypothetical protein
MKRIVTIALLMALSASMPGLAAKPPSSDPLKVPLVALFMFPEGGSFCEVLFLPGDIRILSGGNSELIRSVGPRNATVFAAKTEEIEQIRFIVELLIRLNGLSLSPDDFFDQSAGTYDCTNEKLFALLDQ